MIKLLSLLSQRKKLKLESNGFQSMILILLLIIMYQQLDIEILLIEN